MAHRSRYTEHVADSAQLAALKMLARRELSEAQLRRRLEKLGYEPGSIASAIERLKESRSIDDARVAGAIARTETGIRGRGRMRVHQRLAQAGIPAAVAARAVDEVFEQVDVDALLLAALERRLRGRTAIADEREFARLYRHLIGQGFEHERVLSLLRSRRQS